MSELLKRVYARCVEDGDCQVWQGSVSSSGGMPVMYHEGKNNRFVRRVVYQESKEIPEGRVISPVCGNRLCVAHEHLHAMTNKHSKQLAAKRGAYSNPAKIRKGVKTKLKDSWITDELVERIKSSPGPARVVSEETGVSLSHCKNIRNGSARRDFSNPFAALMG